MKIELEEATNRGLANAAGLAVSDAAPETD
jgi:hypothetical protein